MEVCRTSRLRIQPLLLLVELPFADLIPRHAVEEAVLVADAEEPSGEPPLDRATNCCSAAPAIGIAATLVIRRVMNALEQRALGHCQSLASAVADNRIRVRAEDAAITGSRRQQGLARLAVLEVLAGIERHRLDPRIAALGAGDSSRTRASETRKTTNVIAPIADQALAFSFRPSGIRANAATKEKAAAEEIQLSPLRPTPLVFVNAEGDFPLVGLVARLQPLVIGNVFVPVR
jgi:hypothetical protein